MRIPRLVSASLTLAVAAIASAAASGCGYSAFGQSGYAGYPNQNPNQQNYAYQRQFSGGRNGNPRVNQALAYANANVGNGGPQFVRMDPLAGTDPNWATRYNPVFQPGILARADARQVMMVPTNVTGGVGPAPAPATDPALGHVVEALDAMAQAQHQQQLEIERLRRGRRPAPTAP